MTLLQEITPLLRNLPENSKKEYSIYIVDDDYFLNELVDNKLKKAGYDLQIAISGEELLSQVDDFSDNTLLVIDYLLPDMDGKELISRLNERGVNIPFIVATGYGDEKLAVDLMKMGARDYIIKDCNYLCFLPDILDRVIENIITEKNLDLANLKLAENEARFTHLFQHIPEAVFSIDFNGQFLDFNPALCRLLDETPTNLPLINFSDLLGSWEKFSRLIKRINEKGSIKSYEVDIVKRDGEKLHCLLSALVLENGKGIQGILRDVSANNRTIFEMQGKQRQLEHQNLELIEMATALRTMHDSITNDLRAPLWRLDGYCQALCEQYGENVDTTGKTYLDQIHKDSQRITQFVNDIMILSRINESAINRTAVDFSDLAKQIIGGLKINYPGLTEKIFVGKDLLVDADRPLISMMLRFLFTHALDFLDIYPEAEITLGRDREKPQYFCLTISGVKSGTLALATQFTPLYEPCLNTDKQRSGVDLVAAQRIVNLHGGRLLKDISEPTSYRVLFCFSPLERQESAGNDKNNVSFRHKC